MTANVSDSSEEVAPPSATPFSPSSEPQSDGIPDTERSPKGNWRWMLLLLFLPIGLLAWRSPLLSSFAPTPVSEPVPEPRKALPVETQTLEPINSYQTDRAYTGELVARRRSELGFERSGTIITVLVDEGDVVSAGDAIAQLDTRAIEATRQQILAEKAEANATLLELKNGARAEDIAAARANVAEIEQQLALAERKTARRENLYLEGAISREDFDLEESNASALRYRLNQANSELDALLAGTRSEKIVAQAARVQQLDARLQSLEIDVSKSTIRAPFSGQVSDRFIDEGRVVSPGTPVIALIERGSLEARIGVPSATADTLQTGQTHSLEIGNQTLFSTITALLPELDSSSRTVTVVLDLAGNDRIRVGQTARLVLSETQAIQGFWVPSTALIPADRGLWSIYAIAPSEDPDTYIVARRDVEILHTEGDRALVRGTLQPGDRIIPSGTHRIVTGQQVTPIER
ncbi:efflux RND transporter periplasmic adaptor subunit [Roseofilum casamattae]|uniref:Efflux RND transporter periplasmic adaptor subunit n=1 Tax=Roseofilum casamattae BLCC-M143 TaxID=3022442 RepID=A0ABT7BZV2_9CYAN|nr:efflux RND transporter periplasmic adaptor subunit [Roseofilum casamattae]MDJ1184740.1 efflux RND transporter periplasmic adaptor subunit [Roseofilum casamattae BLCC-M143]